MMPWVFLLMIASSDESTMAARRARAALEMSSSLQALAPLTGLSWRFAGGCRAIQCLELADISYDNPDQGARTVGIALHEIPARYTRATAPSAQRGAGGQHKAVFIEPGGIDDERGRPDRHAAHAGNRLERALAIRAAPAVARGVERLELIDRDRAFHLAARLKQDPGTE